MKSLFSTLLLTLVLAVSGFAQVTWTKSFKQVQGDEYDLIFKATVQKGFYTYSQFLGEGGPVPTSINLESDNAVPVGKPTEVGHKVELNDPLFDNMHIVKFKDEVTFTQRVKIKDYSKPVMGYLDYMFCDEAKCSKQSHDFSFSISKSGAGTTTPTPAVTEPGKDPKAGSTPEVNVAPEAGTAQATIDSPKTAVATTSAFIKDGIFNPRRETITADGPVDNCGQSKPAEDTLIVWLLIGLSGGLVALLTPCIYPMIPLTVSFFTESSKTRAQGIQNAVLYGSFITLIYLLLGLVASFTIGAAGLNNLATNWIFNTVIFVVLIAFSFSFFGYFELTLPSSWTTKTDSVAGRGGLLGIFFMALTLVLVSFSCTGPIAASLMVKALDNPASASLGMLGFGLALGLPFGLFAAFPGMIQSIPKSGGWMNSVKVFLGFLELALAFKFLSTADLTMHWGILKYEIFLGIWILVCLLNAAYFLGLFKFKKYDTKLKLSPVGVGIAVFSLGLATHFGMGFIRNPETCTYSTPSLVSGLAPPTYYTLFKGDCAKSERCPIGLPCFRDYEEGLAFAKANNKMIMIDFTGYGCVNCRKMEELVWVLPEIYPYLRDDVVLISLYVDDREKLGTVLRDPDGNKLRTKGDLWSAFEQVNFKYNAQPYYALLSPDEKLLVPARGYTPDVKEYKAFFECAFEALKKVCPDCHQPAR